jgi:hypothetical protein
MEDLNPLKRFISVPEVLELVLQHLTIEELLLLGLTSSYSDASVFGLSDKRIVLQIQKNTIAHLPSIRRQYRNIKINKNNVSKKDAAAALEMLCHIISVEVILSRNDTSVPNISSSKFQELTIRNMHDTLGYIAPDILNKIESLRLDDSGMKAAFDLIKCCVNLKQLSMTNIKDEYQLLINLSEIEWLNLETFHFSVYSNYNFCPHKNELYAFIEKNANFLKKLFLDMWPGITVLKLIMSLKYLKELKINEMAKSSTVHWELIRLPQSNSITRLYIEDLNDCPTTLNCILRSCPNILKLKVHQLSDDISQVIKENCKHLVELDSDIPNDFGVGLDILRKWNTIKR